MAARGRTRRENWAPSVPFTFPTFSIVHSSAILRFRKFEAPIPKNRQMLLRWIAPLIAVFLLVQLSEPAKFCYSGQNNRFAKKHCSSGSIDIDYVCQKYTCTGGRSPFVLRTCALKTTGCLAGPRICKFSGGQGQCDKCDGDLCNG